MRESEGWLRSLIEAIDDGVDVKDEHGRYVMVNSEWCRRLGLSRKDVLGKMAKDVLNPERAEQVMRYHREVMARETILEFEEEFPDRERAKYCLARRAPLFDAHGKVVGVVTVSRDITERKQMEEQLRRAQRVEAAGRVAAQVAHDYNNLLGPLAGYPALIKRLLPDDHPAAQQCDLMLEAVSQLAEINDDMLVLARSGRLERQDVELNRLIEQVLDAAGELPRTLVLKLELASDLPAVKAPPGQLRRVVMNLVQNAREAMGDSGTLTIQCSNVYLDRPVGRYNRVEAGEYVQLRVSDTGCGIPAEILDKIFDPFFTTKGWQKRGGGLGLSIVQAIIDEIGGYVDLETALGKGTTFSIFLPVSRDAPKGEKANRMQEGKKRVLVVDDDPLQRQLARDLLSALGYEVMEASCLNSVVQTIDNREVDLLLVDMMMHGETDGVEIYREALLKKPKLKAILMSGYEDSERIREARQLGVARFIKKPLTLKRLAVAVVEELNR